MLRDDLPVIGIRDHFDGEGADQAKVFLLNLMADGAVTTPGGAKNVGDGFAVPAGVTRLGFIGQTFPKHPSQGIDWDLYVIAVEPQEAFLAQWSHKNVCAERQHILRLRGTGEFLVVIVPRVKGAPAPEVTVTAEKGGATVTAGGVTARF